MNLWGNAVSKWRWLEEDDGKGGGNSGTGTGEQGQQGQQGDGKGKETEPDLTTLLKDVPKEVQAHFGQLISQARKDGRAAAEGDAETKRLADEAAAKIEADKAKGNFEAAETALKGQLKTATDERDALKKRLDDMNDAMGGRVEELKKGMSDIQLDGFPAEGDALEQVTWLEARKAWLAKLGGGEPNKKGTGNTTPDRTGRTTGDVEQAEVDRIQRNNSYGL